MENPTNHHPTLSSGCFVVETCPGKGLICEIWQITGEPSGHSLSTAGCAAGTSQV